MIINLAEKSSDRIVIIETNHNDPDKAISVKYDGDRSAIAKFYREASEGKHGHYGHIFHLESTTNLDLQKVVYDLEDFAVLKIEPKIKAKKLPKGVMT